MSSGEGGGAISPSIPQNILVAGTGGQGVISLTRMLGEVLHTSDSSVTLGQLHGMSQRGGTVCASIRSGSEASTHVPPHSVELLIGLELMETCRQAELVAEKGAIISLDFRRSRSPFLEQAQPSPSRGALISELRGFCPTLHLLALPGNEWDVVIRTDPGMALLGWAAGNEMLGLSVQELREGVSEQLSSKRWESGLRAFDAGEEFLHEAHLWENAEAEVSE